MDASPPASRRRRRIAAIVAAALAAPILLLVLAAAIVPLGWLRAPAGRALSAGLGRAVTLGSVERLDPIGFVPRVAVRDVRIAQPAWAGRGDMVRLRAATFRLALLPALFGHARPRDIAIEGLRAALVHDARGRANWEGGKKDGGAPPLRIASIRDARIALFDRRRRLTLTATLAADARGLRLDATGTHRTSPATLRVRGARIDRAGRWRFRAAFASPLAQATLDGAMDAPLALSHFDARATAAGGDLRIVDDLIGAGLPDTQPVRLAGHVRHDGEVWTLTRIAGAVGRSDVAGDLTIDRIGGRTRIEGRLASNAFDFDDLASDEGLAKAAAKRARLGPRVIPDTLIDLAKLARTDARIDVRVRRVLSRHQSAIRAAATVVTLDRSRLVARPLRLDLAHGYLAGSASIDQRGHGPVFAIGLALRDARLEDYLKDGRVDGPLHGRIVLAGRGGTVRAALARANGEVRLAAPGGSVDLKTAQALGRNAGEVVATILKGGAPRTPLRCAVARFRAARGVLRPALFAFDTGVTSAQGRGAIDLDGETLSLILDGRSKDPGLALLPSPISIEGTLSAPVIQTGHAGIGSAGTIVKTLGSAIGGLLGAKRPPPAPDLDCAALLRRVGG